MVCRASTTRLPKELNRLLVPESQHGAELQDIDECRIVNRAMFRGLLAVRRDRGYGLRLDCDNSRSGVVWNLVQQSIHQRFKAFAWEGPAEN